MTVKIKSNEVFVECLQEGAMLHSLVKNGREYLWQGDKSFWAGQAPVCFPIAGVLRDGRAVAFGKECSMKRHGVARINPFKIESVGANYVAFVQNSSEKTKAEFPFDYRLEIKYTVVKSTVTTQYTVYNTGKEKLPFVIGGHPAFNCPVDKNEAFDYPVRQEFFALARIRSKCECVLFLGGSQGASAINALALALAPILNQRGVKIIHQCGAKEYKSVRAKYDELGIKARIYDFSEHLPELMSRADVCVSRAGASSLWELCANALPSVFIPYPYAAGDHQYYNAKFLADLGLAGLFRQESLESSAVLEFIDNMDLASISASLKEKINMDGSQKIVDEVLKNIKI